LKKIYYIKVFIIFIIYLSCDNHINNLESQNLHKLLNDEWDRYLFNNPELSTYIDKNSNFNHLLNDRSIASISQINNENIKTFKRLVQIKRSQLNKSDKLNYDLYKTNLINYIENYSYRNFLIPLSRYEGIHIELKDLFKIMPLNTVDDLNNYLSRLKQIPLVITQTINLMKQGMKENIIPSKVSLKDVTEQINFLTNTNVSNSPFFKPIKNINIYISQEKKDSIENNSRIIIKNDIFTAFSKLENFIKDIYYPNARNEISILNLPNGKKYYEYLIKHYTSTSKNPSEIHKIGLNGIDSVKSEIINLMDELNYVGTFSEFLKYMRTSKSFYYSDSEILLNKYRSTCKQVDPLLNKLFKKLPRSRYGIDEKFEKLRFQKYYYNNYKEKSYSNYFNINSSDLKMHPTYEIQVIALKETAPGKFFQNSIVNESNYIPTFRKFLSYPSYIKGWISYSGSLGYDMDLYNDPYSRFGQLCHSMFYYCGLVVDTGIHAFGWSRQKSIDFILKNTPKILKDIENEVDHCITYPGNILSYKMGEKKIYDIRKNAENILKDNFDISQFHDKIIELGPLPNDIFEEQIINYIKEKINTK